MLKDKAKRSMLLNARRLDREGGRPDPILLAFADVTKIDASHKGDNQDG